MVRWVANRRMTYKDFLHRAIELKVNGVSLETCFFESLDDAYLKELREIIDQGHLEPVVAWGHPKGFEGGNPHRPWPISRTCIAFATSWAPT